MKKPNWESLERERFYFAPQVDGSMRVRYTFPSSEGCQDNDYVEAFFTDKRIYRAVYEGLATPASMHKLLVKMGRAGFNYCGRTKRPYSVWCDMIPKCLRPKREPLNRGPRGPYKVKCNEEESE